MSKSAHVSSGFKRISKEYADAPTLITLKKASFYNDHPSSLTGSNSFKPILGPVHSFQIPVLDPPSGSTGRRSLRRYAVIGTNPSPFLKALKGDYIALPPGSRTYPYLSSPEARLRLPSQAIRYVGFNSENKTTQGVQGAYLSARYESRREETDWTVEQYLKGQTELNATEIADISPHHKSLYQDVVKSMQLEKLLTMPVSNLSNGQTRRSRIAKALLEQPELLILDEPFMGLDPPTLARLHGVLRKIAIKAPPTLLLGLRPQDPVPDWITQLIVLDDMNSIITNDRLLSALYMMNICSRGISGDAALPAEISLARAMKRKHGDMPFGNARILTATGTRTFEVPHVDLAHLKDESGFWNDNLRADKDMRDAAESQPPQDRRILEWRILTSSLYAKRHDILEEAFKKFIDEPEVARSGPQIESLLSNSTRNEESLIEMSSIIVKYGEKTVLGHAPPQPGYTSPGLNLNIHRGSRILLLGPNGSGKTTLLSLLTSDHPQSYALPIKFFGRTRLAERGKPELSLWEIQSRIGHSSPEVHTFFPKHFTVRQVLESAWAETFTSKPTLKDDDIVQIDRYLEYWMEDLCQEKRSLQGSGSTDLSWANDKHNHPRFGALPFGIQRLLLLLRAIIKKPDIVVLDEPLSGMPPKMRDKVLNFLERGVQREISHETNEHELWLSPLTAQQALIVVSHVREEIPYSVDEFVRLPSEDEAREGMTLITGKASDIRTEAGWNRIWGLSKQRDQVD